MQCLWPQNWIRAHDGEMRTDVITSHAIVVSQKPQFRPLITRTRCAITFMQEAVINRTKKHRSPGRGGKLRLHCHLCL